MSEVVGVALMVAVTVLLVATAATLLFGFQEQRDDFHPGTAFEFSYEPTAATDTVSIVHASGDTVEAADLEVVISDATATAGDPDGRYTFANLSGDLTPERAISTGTSVVLSPQTIHDVPNGTSIDFSEASVRVVWTDSDRTMTLQTWYGPDR